MSHKSAILIALLHIILTLNSWAQKKSEQYYYQNAVYSKQIKSVQLFRDGNVLSFPVIELGGSARLLLKFDDLSDEAKDYNYTVIHCDENWNESFIRQNEYLKGIPDNPITDIATSFNTTVKYVNYQLSIPNENCNPTLSGNYALVVFEGQDRKNLVLIQRFYLVEPSVRIDGQVKKATFDPFMGENQEVDFKITNQKLRLLNPTEDIRIVLMQNRRWDNAVKGLKPSSIQGNVLTFDYSKENVFPGGNEFRYFDIRTKRYTGENVGNIQFIRPYYHMTVLPEGIRKGKNYRYYKEMNGNFVVESQDRMNDADTECDYFFVHFFLPMESPLTGGTVNVFGALTGWNVNESNEMKWSFENAGYELSLLLKQGYYNYCFVYVPERAAKADAENIEGTFFETENDYQILAYYRDLGSRYTRLVGFQSLNSVIKN